MSELLDVIEEKKKKTKKPVRANEEKKKEQRILDYKRRLKEKKPKQQKLVDVSTLTNKNVLREPAVQARTGLKTTALNDAIERGEFPAPFHPTESGRTRVWLEAEVDAWLVSRLAQRDR